METIDTQSPIPRPWHGIPGKTYSDRDPHVREWIRDWQERLYQLEYAEHEARYSNLERNTARLVN